MALGSQITNAIQLQGNWDANTNTPDITGTTVTGYAWVVSVAGNTNLGGITTWNVGDMAVKTDGGWTRLSSAVDSFIILQGDWDADTNTPDISTTTTTGFAWRVSVAGSTNLGGITDWEIGDLAIKTDTGWLKIDNSDISAVWGNIVGTLSDQTDLQAALDLKLNTAQASLNGGLISGGVVTITSATEFQVTAGTGWVADWTVPTAPVHTLVTWGLLTGETVPDLATTTFTALGFNAAGTLIKNGGTPLTPQQDRLLVPLQTIIHTSLVTLDEVATGGRPAYQQTQAVLDYLVSIGPSNNGNAITPGVAADLTIQKAAGTTTLPFINFMIDAQNPATKSNAAASPILDFIKTYQDGVGDFVVTPGNTVLSPDNWDDGTGVLATVANNKWTIQRAYFFGASNTIVVTYGQAEYGNLADAEAAIFSESPTVNPFLSGATFLTAIILKKGVTDLTQVAEAEFVSIDVPGSSSSGGGIGDMTKAVYDPTGVIADAFLMGNFAETATAKVLTDVERTAIGAALSKTATADQAILSSLALADDKVLALGASTINKTTLLSLEHNSGNKTEFRTFNDDLYIELAAATSDLVIRNSADSESLLTLSGDGIRTGPASIPAAITGGTGNGKVLSNLGVEHSSRSAAGTQDHHVFYDTTGQAGRITTDGAGATAYVVSSDPRLKDFLDMLTAAQVGDEFSRLLATIRMFEFKKGAGKQILGFDARKAIEAKLLCGLGVEGEGPVDMGLGEVYKTTQEDIEVQRLIVDGEGKPVLDEDDKKQYKTVTIKKNVEHKVTPAGVDQGKITPLLALKIDQVEKESKTGLELVNTKLSEEVETLTQALHDQSVLINGLTKRLDANGIYLK